MVTSNPPVGPFEAGRRTERLRPRHNFTRQEAGHARTLKKQGLNAAEIAEQMEKPVHEVEIVLAQLRTRRSNPDRKTVNVGIEAGIFIENEKLPHEATWQTMDRILTELQDRRSGRIS